MNKDNIGNRTLLLMIFAVKWCINEVKVIIWKYGGGRSGDGESFELFQLK